MKDKIWSAALRKLEVRAQSKKELIEKLLVKFPKEEGLILMVIEEMERVHLLSDSRFTEEFVAHLIQKNIGRMKVIHEAKQKGLALDLVEQALLDQNWSEEEAVQRAIEEKKRTLENVDERKKKQKLLMFLRNRGFSDRVIYALLNS